MLKPSKKLQALFYSLSSGKRRLNRYLPVYARKCVKPHSVWSYDGKFAIVGSCPQDLKIVPIVIVNKEIILQNEEVKTDIFPA